MVDDEELLRMIALLVLQNRNIKIENHLFVQKPQLLL